MEGIPLEDRVEFFEQRIPYFSGFGAPLTLVVLCAPHFVSTGLYALIFPLFIIQAIESHPKMEMDSKFLWQLKRKMGYSNKRKENRVLHKPMRIPVFCTTKVLYFL